ncbi:hypothetical protein UM89_07675 [Bacillus subtilis]|nr:hypothetical protein UM89_07675 [Bacillus subtilis]
MDRMNVKVCMNGILIMRDILKTFVEDVLNYMGASEASIVLDPWIGSGTNKLLFAKGVGN